VIASTISEIAKHQDSSALSTQNSTDTVQTADRANIFFISVQPFRACRWQIMYVGLFYLSIGKSCLPPIVVSDDKNSH